MHIAKDIVAKESAERPRRRTQAERRATTRARLLAGAIDTITDLGITQATTIEIARRAGVSRGALQHHFASRTDLLTAVVDEVQQSLIDRFERLPAEGASAAERAGALIGIYWQVYGSPGYFAVLEILLGTRRDPELGARCQRMLDDMEEVREERWQRLFAGSGLARPDIRALRNVVTATLRGLVVRRAYWSGRFENSGEVAMLARMCAAVLEAQPVQ